MVKTYNNIKTAVHKRIKKKTFHSLYSFIKNKNPSLWGVKKHWFFLRHTLYVFLYKDMYAVGYRTLTREIRR